MARSRLVYVHGCWLAIESENKETLEKAEAILEAMDAEMLLYEGVPLAVDCERIIAAAQEHIKHLDVKIAAAWRKLRCY